MSTDIATAQAGELVVPQANSDMSIFGKIAKSSGFFPYISLLAANAGPVMDRKSSAGNFVIQRISGIAKDLGQQFTARVFDWRPTAMDLTGPKPVGSHDPASDIFQKCMAGCEVYGSNLMAGPEFLLYVPDFGFTTFFMANKTMKNAAQIVITLMNKNVTFTSELIDNNTHKWYGPKIAESNMPIVLPTQEELNDASHSFKNAKGGTVEPQGEPAPQDGNRG